MKILVIGERCIDEFIYCNIIKISPEAPVPVLKPISNEAYFGMSGNVVTNVIDIAKILEMELSHENVKSLYQFEDIIKSRYIDQKSNQQFIRVDLEKECKPMMFKEFKHWLEGCDIIIVSDYNKGFLNNEILRKIGKSCKLTILDTKREINQKVVNAFTFIKMNESEAEMNKKLLRNKNIIVTAGGKGAFCSDRFYPTEEKQTVDVTGAGDTFTAAFILKYYLTASIKKSIKFANEMAGIVVTKRGISTPL